MTFDLSSVPIVGGLWQWTQDRAADAVRYVAETYRDYEATKAAVPALRAQYTRAIVVARDAEPAQRERVAAFGDVVNEMDTAIERGDSAIQRVVTWYRTASGSGSGTGMSGLGVVPVVPVAILVVLGVAVLSLTTIITKRQEAQMLAAEIRAGFTPEQIVRAGMQSSPMGMGGTLVNVGWLLLAGLALVTLRPMFTGDRK